MIEEVLATARSNPLVDPSLTIWSWEIAIYLFLGGVTAGIMCISAMIALLNKEQQAPFAAWRLPLWAPILLSLGMTTLFLDLEHKLFVYRFYTTFQPAAPMSYGAWILIFVYPASIALILATLRQGYPLLASYVDRPRIGTWLLDWAERHRKGIALGNIPFGIALGIYTGILLSAFMARPFWNTAILGPLFLVSGLSTAAALAALLGREASERHLFTAVDVGLIITELAIIALLLISLAIGARLQLQALESIFGGPYTIAFWLWFVSLGLLVPLILEIRELGSTGKEGWVFLAPILVLVGGFLLRQIAIDIGQDTGWTHFSAQFDPSLLERLYH
ncbi:MAG: polysulfide reductase NrfD [Chromatiaceae bacterium]